MAIKERKQITGTTAQIDAYAGHEGQIVWDKEKKTFVGMSGTSGKNYPLAQQAYVDTQFLPKSGGVLLGGAVDLQSEDGNATAQILRSAYESEFEGVDIITEVSNKDSGAILSLRANSCADKAEAGSFNLRTGRNPNVYFLRGRPDGALTWIDRPVITQDHHSDRTVENSWQHVFRFNNGLQIIYGIRAGSVTTGDTVTYDSPFAKAPSIQATIWGPDYITTNPTAAVHVVPNGGTNFRLWSTWNNWIYGYIVWTPYSSLY